MSKNNLNNEPYKQRFKGVENFLRRVAFNLGNTASQTEVKIISCIPIDVTDLQQKVINLEKQLHEAKQQSVSAPGPSAVGVKEPPTSKPAAVVNTALYGTSFANQPSTVSYYSDRPLENKYQTTTHCDNFNSKRKSNVSFLCPSPSTPQAEQVCNCSSREDVDRDKHVAAERYINIFKKRKRKKVSKGKSKMKTHLVYFAQTQNSPFNLKAFKHIETLNNAETTSYAYLNNVIRRQYDPKLVEEFSDTSHFSKPVCRDTDACLYESDVCSCCHGRFRNIDNYMTKNYDPMDELTEYDTNKIYYDSNLYDIIPVKENANKFIKDELLPKNIEIRCWPENFRNKYRHDPIVVNYQTEIPQKLYTNKISQKIKHKIKPEISNIKQNRLTKQEQRSYFATSKTCSIDCGDIYKKLNYPVVKSQKSEPARTILLKNELIETDALNTVLLNNQGTQLELIPDENKTELTLNQIKSILQSVLAEVKTSPKVNTAPDKKPKKDALVQKGASQNNIPGESTLLHSFTYNNSYNAYPYLPSCSRQAAAQYCFTGIPYQPPVKCLQHFPLIIQPPSGRPMCTCYHQNSSHKSSNNRQATATATNTDKKLQRASSKETEKLIKEIYKSITLNTEFPTKDTSVSEYDDLKSAEIDFVNDVRTKTAKSAGMETVNTRDIEIEGLISPNISNNNKLVYTARSTQSEGITYTNESRHYERAFRNEATNSTTLHSNNVIDEDDEETNASNDETENDEPNFNEYEQPQKPERKGFLHRMFKSVKFFKKRRAKQENESEEENISEASDSDDYETIYSGRTAKMVPRRNQQNKIREREKSRLSPYLEQEYRRRWNERLMFDKQRKFSSERPFSKRSSKTPRPIFWNNYEARSAIIGHNYPNELKCLNSNRKDKISKEESLDKINNDSGKEKRSWLKKHKLGVQCGEQWKKFLLEN